MVRMHNSLFASSFSAIQESIELMISSRNQHNGEDESPFGFDGLMRALLCVCGCLTVST